MKYASLARKAATARKNSYSPYSRFRVGAALLTRKGIVYTGSNIENSSYGLTICAERAAFCNAFSHGERQFTAIAICSDAKEFTPPCGACRQVMMDLAGNIDVILARSTGATQLMKLADLFPFPFGSINLKHK